MVDVSIMHSDVSVVFCGLLRAWGRLFSWFQCHAAGDGPHLTYVYACHVMGAVLYINMYVDTDTYTLLGNSCTFSVDGQRFPEAELRGLHGPVRLHSSCPHYSACFSLSLSLSLLIAFLVSCPGLLVFLSCCCIHGGCTRKFAFVRFVERWCRNWCRRWCRNLWNLWEFQ